MTLDAFYIATYLISNGLYVTAIAFVYSRCLVGNPLHKKKYPIIYIGVYFLLLLTDFIAFDMVFLAAYHILCISFPVLFYRATIQKKIFLPVFIFIVGLTTEVISGLAIGFFYGIDRLDYMEPGIIYLIAYCISKTIHYLLILLIPQFLPKDYGLRVPLSHWIAIIATPVLSYIAAISFWTFSLAQSKVHGVVLFTVSFLLLFNFYILFIFGKISHDYENITASSLRNMKYGLYSRQYNQQEPYFKGLEEFRHDIKNVLLAIKLDSESGNTTGMNKKLNKALGLIEHEKSEISDSGNPVIDGIINFKAVEASGKGIPLTVEVELPRSLKLDAYAYDLSAILGNAIDNSMEACLEVEEETRFVHIRIHLRYDQLYIEVRNSFDGHVEEDDSGNLISTKRNEEHEQRHGIGLDMIRRISEKHKGFFHITYDNHCFSLIVLLSLDGKSNIDKIRKMEVSK